MDQPLLSTEDNLLEQLMRRVETLEQKVENMKPPQETMNKEPTITKTSDDCSRCCLATSVALR